MGLPWIQRSNKPVILYFTASCCSTAWVHRKAQQPGVADLAIRTRHVRHRPPAMTGGWAACDSSTDRALHVRFRL